MHRGCASFFLSLVLMASSGTLSYAKDTASQNLTPKITTAQATTSTTSNTSKSSVNKQAVAEQPNKGHSSTITEEITVQSAVVDESKQQPEPAKFTSPPGALYTSSDECG